MRISAAWVVGSGLLVAGCGGNTAADSGDRVTGTSSGIGGATSTSSGGAAGTTTAASCDPYPLSVQPAPGAREAAEAELTSLAPGAELTWNDARGAPEEITGLGLALTDCGEGEWALTHAWNLVADAPSLFRLDGAEWEWTWSQGYCTAIDEEYYGWASRTHMGGQPTPYSDQRVTFGFERRDGVLRLEWIRGEYLPVVDEALAEQLGACAGLDDEAAADSVRAESYPYTVFDGDPCAGSSATYEPSSDDVVEFDEPVWKVRWEPGRAWVSAAEAGDLVLRKTRAGTLQIDSSNYTPQLEDSDANADSYIGFNVEIDAVTGDRLYSEPFSPVDCL